MADLSSSGSSDGRPADQRDLAALAQRLTGVHGPEAADWCERIPDLLRELESEWEFAAGEPFRPPRYAYVVRVQLSEGTPAVLKLGYPGTSTELEIEALARFVGRGAVKLLRYDMRRAAMLLEHIRPGITVAGLSEDAGLTAFETVVTALHQPISERTSFPTIRDWAKGFARYRRAHPGAGPIPGALFAEAERVHAELAGSQGEQVLLHGDLHHANMLLSESRGWLAVDPQGVIGERAYEAGAFLRNPIERLPYLPGLAELLARRVERLGDLVGMGPRRVAGWGFSQAVLSAIWSLEDDEPGWEAALAIAEALRPALASL